jgi:ABC-2 type transport system ATP-binding protein
MLFSTDSLTKSYGSERAVDGLSIDVPKGRVGLLGPNGAGKSTLIRLLLGLIDPDHGALELLGEPVRPEETASRRAIGYMPEHDAHLPHMTAVESVAYSGRLSGLPRDASFQRAHQVLRYVGLDEARYRPLSGYSTGMLQRAKLAQSIVHDPDLLFLDEPTSGLDPDGRREMLKLVDDLGARGTDLIVSSHLLHEVEQVCDRILVLDEGQVAFEGAIAEMTGDDGDVVEVRVREDLAPLADALDASDWSFEHDDTTLRVRLEADRTKDALLEIALDAGVQIRHFMPARRSLEAAVLGVLDPKERAE